MTAPVRQFHITVAAADGFYKLALVSTNHMFTVNDPAQQDSLVELNRIVLSDRGLRLDRVCNLCVVGFTLNIVCINIYI